MKENIVMKFSAILFTVLAIAGATYSLVKSWPDDRFWVILMSLCVPGLIFSLWRLIFEKEINGPNKTPEEKNEN